MKIILIFLLFSYIKNGIIEIGIEKRITNIENIHLYSEFFSESFFKLKNNFGVQYVGTLNLQSQNFRILFDSGSSVMWLCSKKCDYCSQYGVKHFYQCPKRCSLGKKIQINYGKGVIIGRLTSANLKLPNKISVKNQQFLLIKSIGRMPNIYFDGIIGLGRSKMDKGIKTLMDNLKLQNQIKAKIFSIYLSDEKDKQSYESALIIGGVNKKYQGEIMFYKVNSFQN